METFIDIKILLFMIEQISDTCHYSLLIIIHIGLSNRYLIILVQLSRLIALTNDSPRWPVCVGEEAASLKKKRTCDSETRLTFATTRSPLLWRFVHSKRLVSPLACKRADVSSLELASLKASP